MQGQTAASADHTQGSEAGMVLQSGPAPGDRMVPPSRTEQALGGVAPEEWVEALARQFPWIKGWAWGAAQL